MAIRKDVHLTSSMLARLATLEQVGMSDQEMLDFFLAREEEQVSLINSGEMENPEVQTALAEEYAMCARHMKQAVRTNEMLRIQNMNAMQYAQEFKPRTVGELMTYLHAIKARWSDEDTEFLGEFDSLPLCMMDGIGIHMAYAQLAAEHGLITIDPTLG